MGRKKGQKVMIKKGKTALHLEQHWSFNFDDVSEDSLIIKGNILYYLIDNTVVNLMDKLMPLLKTDTRSRLCRRAHMLHKLYTKMDVCNLSVECNRNKFDKFCQELFMVNLPLEEMAIVPQMMETEDTSLQVTQVTQVTIPAPCLQNPASPVKTRFGDKNLDLLVRTQRQVIATNERTIRELKSQLRMKKPGAEQQLIKALKEKIKRRDSKILVLKETPTRKEITLLKRRIVYWKKKATSPRVEHSDVNAGGNRGGELGTIAELENKIFEWQEELAQIKSYNAAAFKRDGLVHTPQMRMMVFNQLNGHTSTTKMKDVLRCNAQLMGMDLNDNQLPSRTTVERMQIELGVISDLRAAEFLYNTDNVTIGFDATTQDGIHVNAINLHNSDTEFTIALDELAGGNSDDYCDHVCSTITYIAELYSKFNDQPMSEVHNTMIGHIKSTMTDSATVNQATIRKINKKWGKTLNVMYCHLHPLDTVASEVKKTLRKMEDNTDDRQLSSVGCVSEKVLAAFDRLRYSDNIGDPRGFKIHLANCGMKKGAVQSTRGNRLHIFFIQAELHANNRDVFYQYVTSHCPKNIDYLEKLRHDYNMAMTQKQLQSVAILSQMLSAPWMRRFYRNAATSFTYMDAYKQVQMVLRSINILLQASETKLLDIGEITTDLFGDEIQTTAPQWTVAPSSRVPLYLRAMLQTVHDILTRQYSSYIRLNEVETHQLTVNTVGCRVNNIICEEIVGLFSSLQKRAPNATILNVSAKIKCTKNRVVPHLMSLDPASRNKTISKCVILATKIKQKSIVERQEMHNDILQRVKAKILQKIGIKRREHERMKKSVEQQVKVAYNTGDYSTLSASYSDEQMEKIQAIIKCDIVESFITHLWYDSDLKKNVVWTGKVIEEDDEMTAEPILTIDYWKSPSNDDTVDSEQLLLGPTADMDDTEPDRTPMSVFQLCSDYLCGDMWFL